MRIIRETTVVAGVATLRAEAANPEVLRLRLRSKWTVMSGMMLSSKVGPTGHAQDATSRLTASLW